MSFNKMSRETIFSIIENPPTHIIFEILDYFNKLCECNNLTCIQFIDMRWALVNYLKTCYSHDTHSMDVRMVCASKWLETAFSDTSPRDAILRSLEKYGRIQKK